MRALFGSLSHSIVWSLGVVLLLVVAAPAWGGDQKCSSSKAADALIECDHCHELKALLREGAEVEVAISVYELSRGVLIDISAADDAGMEFVRRAVAELWGMEAADAGSARVANYCELCQGRNKKLQALERDRAFTDHGAIVVLTSDDRELAGWSRQDAQSLQSLLQRAISSH